MIFDICSSDVEWFRSFHSGVAARNMLHCIQLCGQTLYAEDKPYKTAGETTALIEVVF